MEPIILSEAQEAAASSILAEYKTYVIEVARRLANSVFSDYDRGFLQLHLTWQGMPAILEGKAQTAISDEMMGKAIIALTKYDTVHDPER